MPTTVGYTLKIGFFDFDSSCTYLARSRPGVHESGAKSLCDIYMDPELLAKEGFSSQKLLRHGDIECFPRILTDLEAALNAC